MKSEHIKTSKSADEVQPYRLLFDANPRPMWVYDLDTLAFLSVNYSAVHHYGFSRDEFLAMTIRDILPEEDIPVLEEAVKKGAGVLRKSGPWRHRRKSGEIIDVTLTTHDLRFDGKPARFVLVEDITERRRAEEASSESEKRFHSLFENMIEGFAYCKMLYEDGKPDDFIYIQVNRAFEKLTGLKNVVGKKVSEVIPGFKESSPELFKIYGRVALTGQPERVETYVEALKIWFSISVYSTETGYFITVFDNISDRKRAEKELRTLSRAVEQSPASIVITDTTGAIEYVNPRFEQLTGYSFEEAKGKNPRILKGGTTTPEEYKRLWDTITSGGEWRGEFRNKKKNGEIYWESASISPVTDAAGVITHFLAVKEDITGLKQVEREREEIISLLRATLQSTADGILVVDRTGKITDYNQRFVQLWHIPDAIMASHDDQEAINFVLDQLIDPDGFVTKVNELYSHPEEESFDILEFKDGRCFERYSRPQRISGNPVGRVWSFRDITEQRRAEESLRESEDKFRTLAEQSPSMIFINKGGRVVYANSKCVEVMGYTKEEFYTSDFDFLTLISREDAEKIKDNFAKHLRGEEVVSHEYSIVAKDGTRFEAIITTKLISFEHENAILGTITDIAELKRSEEALRKSEEKYRTLFEESKDMVFTASIEGKILDVNPAGLKLLGYSTKEEMQKLDLALALYWNAGDRAKFVELMQLQGYVQDYELDLKTKDGKRITVLETATAVRDDHGNVVAHRGIIRDITTQKHLERQFLRAQRMESIGTLAGGIAHDLNNVLGPIVTAIDVLRDKLVDERSERILEALAASAQRGADIVNQILAFGRGVESQRILFQPKHIIREMEKIVHETFPKSIQLKIMVPKNLWTILGDPTQIHQVLLNICVNARDAMPNGGLLTVSAENFHIDEYYAKMNIEAREGPYAVVTVADTGTGIAHDIMEHIFDPFFTTKEVGKGTGLGLSTALGIVRSHGGFINVYSEEGRGTSFKVYLPAQTKEQEIVKADERPELPQGQGELIFVVDDEASIREITKVTLENNGYRVITANDGVEAVSKYAKDEGAIKAIIMDMVMPGMDGIATIKALQLMKTTAKIIATSGGAAVEGMTMNSIPGVHAFFKKPYTTEVLLRTLRQVLDT
ncbi:MAG: PAS domain S-box protein [Bacteroidota bacterium]|jgi:PAS domain S-box-containing protein